MPLPKLGESVPGQVLAWSDDTCLEKTLNSLRDARYARESSGGHLPWPGPNWVSQAKQNAKRLHGAVIRHT
jgi:hypothetical protein